MLQRISNFFKAPVFENEDKTRTAWILNILAWGMICINLISTAGMLVFKKSPLTEVAVYFSLIMIAGAVLFVMQKGYVRQASYLFSLTLLATTVTASLFFGGVSGPNAGSYIAVPMIVNLLLGIQAGLIFSLLSIAAIITLLMVDHFGLVALHATIHNNPVSFSVGLVSVVVFMILIQYLFTDGLNQALAHARQNEKLQKALNLELQNARKDMEAKTRQLAEINQTLELRVEERTRELTLINEMRTLLQASISTEEAYQLIGQVLRRLFPGECGALYIYRNEPNMLEAVATWGQALQSEERFAAYNCWGLRRGQLHVMEDNQIGLPCPHVLEPLPHCTLCVPLTAQGATMGILHLQNPQETPLCSNSNSANNLEARKQLAVYVGDQIALSLSNLNMQLTLQQQAIRDPLTGLYNRRYMAESLTRELHRARRKNLPLGVMMMDIDYFKAFNDTYGHDTGDTVLREVGKFLLHNVRAEDITCRYGGEEFLVIFPETSLELVIERASELRAGINQIVISNQGQAAGRISVSIGLASFPEHGDTSSEILQAADSALYQAKAAGRDQFAVYSKS